MKHVWLVIFLCLSSVLFSQNSARVRELEKQRKEALAEIKKTNELLNQTQATTKDRLKRLNLLSQQILSRKKVINLLEQEMNAMDRQINDMGKQISQLESELKEKQANYGKSIQSMYKRQASQDRLLFILSAESFAQSLRRIRYLHEYARWQKRQGAEIVEKQAQIVEKRKELESARIEKSKLLANRAEEQKNLQQEENSHKEEIAVLNKKQKELQALIKQKREQANKLNRLIEQQIAKEIAEAEAKAKAERERLAKNKGKATPSTGAERKAEVKGGYAMTKEEKQLSDNFANNKGKLPYPVTGSHFIVSPFGEQQHQDLKYVRTNNNGIDIQTTSGAEAIAVFKGEVTRIFTIPGYNHSVIVRHGNYLTVYSNLSQVYVKAGDHVSTKQSIGKIYSDPDNGNATILHFQLWKEKTKLNPATWLD